MKKIIYSLMVFVSVTLFMVPRVSATTASVSAGASSSSVTTGNNVTVTVRANSSANLMDSAQATLNFNTSRVQYVSHSGGVFSPIVQTVSGGSFSFAGAILGGSTSGSQTMFSVTFKTVSAGSASFSLSGARVAYAGSELSISSVSGTSVTINDPVTNTPTTDNTSSPSAPAPTTSRTPTSNNTSRSGSTNVAEEVTDTTPPQIIAEPVFTIEPGIIGVTFSSNEPSSATLTYRLKDEEPKQQESSSLTANHSFKIGEDGSLSPGLVYSIVIVLVDEAGNKSQEYSYEKRTKGVVYSVKLVDKDGQPLRNYPVTLFSDPIEAITDNEGVANFEDVTPGEHTIVLEIDGVTVRLPVLVGAPLSLASSSESLDALPTLTLPFVLQASTVEASSERSSLVLAVLSGAAVALLVQLVLNKKWRNKAVNLVEKLYKLLKSSKMKQKITS